MAGQGPLGLWDLGFSRNNSIEVRLKAAPDRVRADTVNLTDCPVVSVSLVLPLSGSQNNRHEDDLHMSYCGNFPEVCMKTPFAYSVCRASEKRVVFILNDGETC